jgi:hypothetical protein
MHVPKKAFSVFFSFSAFVMLAALIFVTPAHAQQKTVDAPACDNSIWVCPSVTDMGANNNGFHTLKLNATGLPTKDPQSGVPIQWYTVCGYDDPARGQVFSSNDKEIDRQLCLGEDTLEYMSRPVSYRGQQYSNWGMELLNGSASPATTADGNLEVYVRPHTFNVQNHTCFFVAKTTPSVVGRDDTNVAAGSKDTDSLTYATFRTQSEPAACVSVRADPFGRVFNDALKPVPGVVVNIYDFTSKKAISLPGVPNPITTKEDGMFNFNIEPGTSYLNTNLVNMDITKVHPNATLAYSNLYTYGDAIVETLNKPEQRDIPVQGGLQPILKIMGFSHLQLGEQTRIEGRASWPLTQVNVMQGNVSVAQQNADKFGGFSFFINNTLIDPSQQLKLVLTEVDMREGTPVIPTNPKTVERVFDPIARYLEGYAYDTSGRLMPLATVRIVLDNTDVVYYETKADDKAFYSISPKFLPILPYHIEYSPANVVPAPANTIKVTLPDFVKKNKEYHDANLIKPMTGTKNGVQVDPGAYVKNKNQAQNGSGNEGGQNGAEPGMYNKGGLKGGSALENLARATGQSSSTLLIVLIILFIVVAATLVMYIRNQRSSLMSSKNSEDYDDEEPEEMV